MTKHTKKFLMKTICKAVFIAILFAIAFNILNSPIINNELAMGQMENDNGLFVAWESYNTVRPYIEIGVWLIGVVVFGTIGYDTYKFFKSKTKENTNEV